MNLMSQKEVTLNTGFSNNIYLTVGHIIDQEPKNSISLSDISKGKFDLKGLREEDGLGGLHISLGEINGHALPSITSQITGTEGFSGDLRDLSIKLSNSFSNSGNAFKTSDGLENLFKNIKKLPNLKTLEISNIQITNTQLRDLAKFLAQGSSIKEIKFDNCLIQSQGAKILAKGLARNNSVETLVLDGNPDIGDEGAVAIAGAMKTSQIKKVYLRGQSARIKADQGYNDSLYNGLNLGNCIGNRGFKAFVDALCESDRIISFDLSDNNIGDDGASYLARKMESFETIVQKRPQIEDEDKELSEDAPEDDEESLEDFMKDAVYQGKPAEIVLKYNIVTDKGASSILEAVNTNPFIVRPDLSENQVSDEKILTDIQEIIDKRNAQGLTAGDVVSHLVGMMFDTDSRKARQEFHRVLMHPIEGPLDWIRRENESPNSWEDEEKFKKRKLSPEALEKKIEEERKELEAWLEKNLDVRLRMKRGLERRAGVAPVSSVRASFSQGAPNGAANTNFDPLQFEMEKLNSMIGLGNVKQKVTKFTNVFRVMEMRERAGLKASTTTAHMIFSGNPGTGKTTVARRLGGILKAIGRLESGHVVTANREDLVGVFIGQTEAKTAVKIKEALGGILFIDEAYSLTQKGTATENDFGKVAIETILTAMEDHRDELVVIAAGYKNEMKQFVAFNPGLESRFRNEIDFEDYSGEELTEIFKLFVSDADYKLDDDVEILLKARLNKLLKPGRKPDNFGNGRFVRNIFEDAVELQAGRVLTQGKEDKDSLMQLSVFDVVVPEQG